MSARGITVIGASAGSGKTYRLTQEVSRAIDPRAHDRVDLEGLVAVTYTRRAHAELAARIRQTLVKAGAFEEAVRLPVAYLGTVHAACLRLLQEFALDAGLSPNVDVVAGDQAKLLRESLEQSVGADRCAELDALAASFELLWQPMLERHDWLRPVTDIMELARGNRISPDALPAMAERSATTLLRLLPPVASDAAVLDATLADALAQAQASLAASADSTKTTRVAVDLIDECCRRLRDGELSWKHWEKIARIQPAKASAALVVELQAAAASYASHPRLHEEITALTRAIFAAARAGLAGYEAWKAERRVVDYVDIVSLALDVVHHPRVGAELAERLRFVVVDEFQDTSPIQLALFLRLHVLAGRSAWVGDRKQCIFEYAGADPALMDSVASWVEASGGARDRLSDNHRSRPELVQACSELFGAALARHGFAREEVVVDAVRKRHPALEVLPPLGLFCLETENNAENAEAVAEGVRRLVTYPARTPVIDRGTNLPRGLRCGDVAVLVATNGEARQIANALHARGIRVALARAGLLSTPEGTLADAALRALLDARDSLSAATIDALTGFGEGSPESWLAAAIRARRDESAAQEPRSGWRVALERVRGALGVLSPSEALDEVLAALDVVQLCARWPDSPQRIANIDALRALASGYEERCRQEREAGTVAGLLRHFDDLRTERLRRDELIASDDQHVSSDANAVTVCTYHKAKGLEWPVVILASLDRTEKRHAFEVRPESDREEGEFDPENPLEGRWIRYWPWPLGALENAPLADAAERSAEGQRVRDREDRERVRLLYVGFTRARDHLVLAVRVSKGKPRKGWLDELTSGTGEELLVLPPSAEDGTTDTTVVRCSDGSPLEVPTRIWRVSPQRALTSEEQTELPRWYARAADVTSRPAYWIAPSRAEDEWADVAAARIGAVEQHGAAIRLEEKDVRHDVLGSAVHAFLAADVDGLSPSVRTSRAERLLVAAGMSAIVRPEALLGASDALRAWVERRWPRATWRREVTIEARLSTLDGERRVSGAIDLLLETAEGRVLIDHKTFPGATEPAWRARVKDFLPQMAAYAEAVSRLDDRPLIACWVHLPMGGGMVEVVRASRGQRTP